MDTKLILGIVFNLSSFLMLIPLLIAFFKRGKCEKCKDRGRCPLKRGERNGVCEHSNNVFLFVLAGSHIWIATITYWIVVIIQHFC